MSDDTTLSNLKTYYERLLQSEEIAENGPISTVLFNAIKLIERLTPKPMTLVDVANVLDRRRHKGHRWYVNESRTHVCTITNEYVYHEPEATYIAQGLLRDTPIATPLEPATGEGSTR